MRYIFFYFSMKWEKRIVINGVMSEDEVRKKRKE